MTNRTHCKSYQQPRVEVIQAWPSDIVATSPLTVELATHEDYDPVDLFGF